MRLIGISIFLYLFNITHSYAYLDPSTTSYILTVIIGFLAGMATFISIWWKRITEKIKLILKKKTNKPK